MRTSRASSSATDASAARAVPRYVAREGHMEKQGYYNRSWKRRFFVLRNYLLSYYGDAGDSRPKATVPLAGSQVVSDVSSDSRPYTFGLKVGAALGGRTYVLACATKVDRDAWVSALSSNVSQAQSERRQRLASQQLGAATAAGTPTAGSGTGTPGGSLTRGSLDRTFSLATIEDGSDSPGFPDGALGRRGTSTSQAGGGDGDGDGSGDGYTERRMLTVFTATWNVGEGGMDMPPERLARWLPLGRDVYAVGLQECLDVEGVRRSLLAYVGEQYIMVDHYIGNGTTTLGFHGFIYLAVLVHTRVVADGMCSLANTVRTAVPLGRQLILARATNKGAVSIALPVLFPDITGRLCVRSSLTFVCCHLTSDKKREPRLAARNENAAEMLAALGLRTAARSSQRALVGAGPGAQGSGWAAGAQAGGGVTSEVGGRGAVSGPLVLRGRRSSEAEAGSARGRPSLSGGSASDRGSGATEGGDWQQENGDERQGGGIGAGDGSSSGPGSRERSVSEWPGGSSSRMVRRLSAGDAGWVSAASSFSPAKGVPGAGGGQGGGGTGPRAGVRPSVFRFGGPDDSLEFPGGGRFAPPRPAMDSGGAILALPHGPAAAQAAAVAASMEARQARVQAMRAAAKAASSPRRHTANPVGMKRMLAQAAVAGLGRTEAGAGAGTGAGVDLYRAVALARLAVLGAVRARARQQEQRTSQIDEEQKGDDGEDAAGRGERPGLGQRDGAPSHPRGLLGLGRGGSDRRLPIGGAARNAEPAMPPLSHTFAGAGRVGGGGGTGARLLAYSTEESDGELRGIHEPGAVGSGVGAGVGSVAGASAMGSGGGSSRIGGEGEGQGRGRVAVGSAAAGSAAVLSAIGSGSSPSGRSDGGAGGAGVGTLQMRGILVGSGPLARSRGASGSEFGSHAPGGGLRGRASSSAAGSAGVGESLPSQSGSFIVGSINNRRPAAGRAILGGSGSARGSGVGTPAGVGSLDPPPEDSLAVSVFPNSGANSHRPPSRAMPGSRLSPTIGGSQLEDGAMGTMGTMQHGGALREEGGRDGGTGRAGAISSLLGSEGATRRPTMLEDSSRRPTILGEHSRDPSGASSYGSGMGMGRGAGSSGTGGRGLEHSRNDAQYGGREDGGGQIERTLTGVSRLDSFGAESPRGDGGEGEGVHASWGEGQMGGGSRGGSKWGHGASASTPPNGNQHIISAQEVGESASAASLEAVSAALAAFECARGATGMATGGSSAGSDRLGLALLAARIAREHAAEGALPFEHEGAQDREAKTDAGTSTEIGAGTGTGRGTGSGSGSGLEGALVGGKGLGESQDSRPQNGSQQTGQPPQADETAYARAAQTSGGLPAPAARPTRDSALSIIEEESAVGAGTVAGMGSEGAGLHGASTIGGRSAPGSVARSVGRDQGGGGGSIAAGHHEPSGSASVSRSEAAGPAGSESGALTMARGPILSGASAGSSEAKDPPHSPMLRVAVGLPGSVSGEERHSGEQSPRSTLHGGEGHPHLSSSSSSSSSSGWSIARVRDVLEGLRSSSRTSPRIRSYRSTGTNPAGSKGAAAGGSSRVGAVEVRSRAVGGVVSSGEKIAAGAMQPVGQGAGPRSRRASADSGRGRGASSGRVSGLMEGKGKRQLAMVRSSSQRAVGSRTQQQGLGAGRLPLDLDVQPASVSAPNGSGSGADAVHGSTAALDAAEEPYLLPSAPTPSSTTQPQPQTYTQTHGASSGAGGTTTEAGDRTFEEEDEAPLVLDGGSGKGQAFAPAPGHRGPGASPGGRLARVHPSGLGNTAVGLDGTPGADARGGLEVRGGVDEDPLDPAPEQPLTPTEAKRLAKEAALLAAERDELPPPSQGFVFLVGDLNYRVRMSPEQAVRAIAKAEAEVMAARRVSLRAAGSSEPAALRAARRLERPWHRLLCMDELREVMHVGAALVGFEEAAITFPPSYRRVRVAKGGYPMRRQAGDFTREDLLKKAFTVGGDSPKAMRAARTPSYTDRVLLRRPTCVRPKMPDVVWHQYDCFEDEDASDHTPVGAGFTLLLRPDAAAEARAMGSTSGALPPSGDYLPMLGAGAGEGKQDEDGDGDGVGEGEMPGSIAAILREERPGIPEAFSTAQAEVCRQLSARMVARPGHSGSILAPLPAAAMGAMLSVGARRTTEGGGGLVVADRRGSGSVLAKGVSGGGGGGRGGGAASPLSQGGASKGSGSTGRRSKRGLLGAESGGSEELPGFSDSESDGAGVDDLEEDAPLSSGEDEDDEGVGMGMGVMVLGEGEGLRREGRPGKMGSADRGGSGSISIPDDAEPASGAGGNRRSSADTRPFPGGALARWAAQARERAEAQREAEEQQRRRVEAARREEEMRRRAAALEGFLLAGLVPVAASVDKGDDPWDTEEGVEGASASASTSASGADGKGKGYKGTRGALPNVVDGVSLKGVPAAARAWLQHVPSAPLFRKQLPPVLPVVARRVGLYEYGEDGDSGSESDSESGGESESKAQRAVDAGIGQANGYAKAAATSIAEPFQPKHKPRPPPRPKQADAQARDEGEPQSRLALRPDSTRDDPSHNEHEDQSLGKEEQQYGQWQGQGQGQGQGKVQGYEHNGPVAVQEAPRPRRRSDGYSPAKPPKGAIALPTKAEGAMDKERKQYANGVESAAAAATRPLKVSSNGEGQTAPVAGRFSSAPPTQPPPVPARPSDSESPLSRLALASASALPSPASSISGSGVPPTPSPSQSQSQSPSQSGDGATGGHPRPGLPLPGNKGGTLRRFASAEGALPAGVTSATSEAVYGASRRAPLLPTRPRHLSRRHLSSEAVAPSGGVTNSEAVGVSGGVMSNAPAGGTAPSGLTSSTQVAEERQADAAVGAGRSDVPAGWTDEFQQRRQVFERRTSAAGERPMGEAGGLRARSGSKGGRATRSRKSSADASGGGAGVGGGGVAK